MEMIRRNTDYALRAMICLAKNCDCANLPAREVAQSCQMPYQITAKLLQKLHKAGLIVSTMGPKGGFGLARDPELIPISDVVEAIQGPVKVNKCTLAAAKVCQRQDGCRLCRKLQGLQKRVDEFLKNANLNDFIENERALK